MSNSFLVEGKTKIIEKTNDQNIIRIVTKDFLTGGDAAKKEEIKDIGIQKTTFQDDEKTDLCHIGSSP